MAIHFQNKKAKANTQTTRMDSKPTPSPAMRKGGLSFAAAGAMIMNLSDEIASSGKPDSAGRSTGSRAGSSAARTSSVIAPAPAAPTASTRPARIPAGTTATTRPARIPAGTTTTRPARVPAATRASPARVARTRSMRPSLSPAARTGGAEYNKKFIEMIKGPSKELRKTGVDVDEQPTLELGLLLDCTCSMSSWIVKAKKTIHEIIDKAIKECEEDGSLKCRVSFVGYRDIRD